MIEQIFGVIVAFFGIIITIVVTRLVVEMWKDEDRSSAILLSWFVIMGILIFLAGVAMATGQVQMIHSVEGVQELNKDCVKFSDGKTAIVLTESGITEDFKLVWCDGSDVAWFISKGYHIDSEQSSLGPIDQVYLTR